MFQQDRRSMLFPEIPDPRKQKSNLPEKVCLISAVVLLCALLGFIFMTGLYVLYVHFWVYVAVISLIVMLLLSAAGFAIYHRIKGERTQRRMAIVLSGLGIGVAVFLIIFTTGFSTNRKPIQFSDSPSGENQIVIMRSTTDFGVLIEAHPSFNGKFFIPMPDTQAVHSNGVIQGVEWDGDWMARVLLCDIYGNDTVIEVDFSLIYDIPESEQSAQ